MGRVEARRILVGIALFLIAVLIVWDLMSADSVLRGLVESDPNPRENARQMLEQLREQN